MEHHHKQSRNTIFRFLLISKPFHWWFCIILYCPFCIASRYQTVNNLNIQSRNINLFLNWHRMERLIMFSHWYSWYSHWQKERWLNKCVSHLYPGFPPKCVIVGKQLPREGTVELHFLSKRSEAIYCCFHITMQLYPWESTGQQECFPSFSFIGCLPALH